MRSIRASLATLITPRLQNEQELTPSRIPWTGVFPWNKGKEANIRALLLTASLDTALCEGALREAKVGKMPTLGYAGVSQSIYRGDS